MRSKVEIPEVEYVAFCHSVWHQLTAVLGTFVRLLITFVAVDITMVLKIVQLQLLVTPFHTGSYLYAW